MLLEQPRPIAERPLVATEIAKPEPGPREVLVRVRACGICRTDLHVVEGDLPVRRSPVIPGHQIVGTVESLGADVTQPAVGQRVGVAWLHATCGACEYCQHQRENLCDQPEFSGWTVDGGFAEYALARADFVYPLPEGVADEQVAPLLCAGIIGYRCLSQTGIEDWSGARLGIYGFGAAGHVAIQIARARGAEVYVSTRDEQRHRALARELGAAWTGAADAVPPKALDSAIIFAPAGELVPPALGALKKGGSLILGGIHMSDIPSFPYASLYGERRIQSVANNTRSDGHAFLREAAEAGVHTHVETFPLERANEVLLKLKEDGIRGAGVLLVDRQ